MWYSTLTVVVSIGCFAAFYVVFVPVECIPSEPPHSSYTIVFSLYLVCFVEICWMWRFILNMLQWNENDIKSCQTTIGDYYFHSARKFTSKRNCKQIIDLSSNTIFYFNSQVMLNNLNFVYYTYVEMQCYDSDLGCRRNLHLKCPYMYI